ncbi:MAG: hypothetical protein Q7V88_07845, partial [Actinomycetota bacterium]|nr:hypothetical protein [Actinomycetota bacterium]
MNARPGRVLLFTMVLLMFPVVTGNPAPVLAADPPPVGASQYVPITPMRLADTRPTEAAYGGFTPINASTLRIDITHRAGVPANATAAVLNITMIGSAGPGFVSVYPTGTAPPTSSNVNADAAGRVIANMAHVKIGNGGSIDLTRSTISYIAVDLVGVYVPVTDAVSSGRLVTLNTGAQRVFDTRDRGYGLGANQAIPVDLAAAGVPADASAVVVGVTAVQAQPGFWTAYTVGSVRPGTSTLNLDKAGQTRSGQAIVPLNGTDRSISVYSQRGGHLLVDVVGWFTGAGDPVSTSGLFLPSSPLRMLDTRTTRTLAPWAGSTYEFTTGSSVPQISAVAMNVTVTAPWDFGFVTAFPAGA